MKGYIKVKMPVELRCTKLTSSILNSFKV